MYINQLCQNIQYYDLFAKIKKKQYVYYTDYFNFSKKSLAIFHLKKENILKFNWKSSYISNQFQYVTILSTRLSIRPAIYFNLYFHKKKFHIKT